ncbi:ATP-binding protein [Xanthomonas campestris pv. campestris]|uniref:AlbA family DNA-binding domain-containing protein n=1 Tax=Xanthomonas campestris TaxID=339 RepID=UPI0032E39F60
MNKIASRSLHESFSQFFENPTRESLRSFLKDHVGELRNCDFKEQWPELASVAKHIVGIANAGGGCLIFGVKEDSNGLEPIGISGQKDKADVISGIKRYLPEPLLSSLEIADFFYTAAEYPTLVGKKFQVLFVQSDVGSLPYVAQQTGVAIRSGGIYIRREGSTEEGNHEDVQRLLQSRVAVSATTAKVSTLKEHLEELKLLYSEVPRNVQVSAPLIAHAEWAKGLARFASMFVGDTEPNPSYPQEDYQAFILRVLSSKKRVIERTLGLPK